MFALPQLPNAATGAGTEHIEKSARSDWRYSHFTSRAIDTKPIMPFVYKPGGLRKGSERVLRKPEI